MTSKMIPRIPSFDIATRLTDAQYDHMDVIIKRYQGIETILESPYWGGE